MTGGVDPRLAMGPSVAIFLLTLAAPPSGGTTVARKAVARPATPARSEVRLLDLAAVRRLVNTLARERPTMSEGERTAAWADFSLVSQAVIGDSQIGPFDFDDLALASASGGGPRVMALAGVARRDVGAYVLLALGYSARETADIVSGRISQQALDTARQMLAVGQTRDAAADYLDRQYKQVVALRNARNLLKTPSAGRPGILPTAFDALIEKYANLHQVESAIVRAIIETESAFNPRALSHKGAIGLMQLMPMTAHELGVDPFVPEQNIEGGVRYFSQLLRMFGGVELALVAYNGGPGYAQRYARGQVALYGETRDYVAKVLRRLNAIR
jgi:soluble lytic murein transglycosylase-like protein